MRIRAPFAGAFFVLLLLAAYVGLTPLHLETYINDKVLHFITFFLLTVVFYWILDTTRRRTLNLTLAFCTGGLSFGSEVLQGFLPNGRNFDLFDIVANVLGSLAALGICTWYHKRMIERRRARKGYGAVPGVDDDGEGGSALDDVELGQGSGSGGQEEGVVDGGRSLEQQVDEWDENEVDDWDDDGDVAGAKNAANGTDGGVAGTKTATPSVPDLAASKKRDD